MNISIYLKQFIECHHGIVNKLIHVIGFTLIGVGIIRKSIWFVIAGAIVQELGHFYEYAKTKDKKYSPLFCLKPQLVFAYPLLILIILYVLLAK